MKLISSFIRPQEFILHAFDNRRSRRQVTCVEQRNLFAASQELLREIINMKFTAINVVDKKVTKISFFDVFLSHFLLIGSLS